MHQIVWIPDENKSCMSLVHWWNLLWVHTPGGILLTWRVDLGRRPSSYLWTLRAFGGAQRAFARRKAYTSTIKVMHTTLIRQVAMGPSLLSWCPILKSSHCNSFEDRAPVDEIYGCSIFKWVAGTWQNGRPPGYWCLEWPPGWHALLYHYCHMRIFPS